ncbi:MAG: shikimate kinase [Actinomycetaceae bacterium]|nr:shikimate kinase [Actinomycetaceae bacterium]
MTRLRSLFVIGVPGAGKSSLAAVLAPRLCLPIVEIDAAIEAATGRSISALMLAGEDTYRGLEAEHTMRHIFDDALVVLTGGALEHPHASALLRDVLARGDSALVTCRVSISCLARRQGLNAPRSVGLGPVRSRLSALMRQRERAWARFDPIVVDTDTLSPSQAGQTVVDALAVRGFAVEGAGH